MMPCFSVEHVRQRLETTFPTASAAVKLLEVLGILVELTGQKKTASISIATRRTSSCSPADGPPQRRLQPDF